MVWEGGAGAVEFCLGGDFFRCCFQRQHRGRGREERDCEREGAGYGWWRWAERGSAQWDSDEWECEEGGGGAEAGVAGCDYVCDVGVSAEELCGAAAWRGRRWVWGRHGERGRRRRTDGEGWYGWEREEGVGVEGGFDECLASMVVLGLFFFSVFCDVSPQHAVSYVRNTHTHSPLLLSSSHPAHLLRS